jgi:hypothetical protein
LVRFVMQKAGLLKAEKQFVDNNDENWSPSK